MDDDAIFAAIGHELDRQAEEAEIAEADEDE